MSCLYAKVSKLVIYVGNLPLKVIQIKNKVLKGMILFHKRGLKWFLVIFSLIPSHVEEKLKVPLIYSVHTTWSCILCCGEISVAMMLSIWLVGAYSINLVMFYCSSSQNSATVMLLNMWVFVENCASGLMLSLLYHQKEKFPASSFHWICCSTWFLLSTYISKLRSHYYPTFCILGWIFGSIFLLKNSPQRVCLVLKTHNFLYWKAKQISFKFLIPIQRVCLVLLIVFPNPDEFNKHHFNFFKHRRGRSYCRQ